MIAPFYGLGPFLGSVLIVTTMLALAIGGRRTGRGAGLSRLRIPLIAAGCWMILAPWSSRALLLLLEPLGLRVDVVIAAALLLGPPLVVLGMVFPSAIRARASSLDEVGRAVGSVYGVAAIGSVASAVLMSFVLIPWLGVEGAAILTGVLLIAGGAAAFDPRGDSSMGIAVTLVLVAIGGLVLSRSPSRATGVLAVASGAHGEIRVLERDGARYLLADGTILTVVEPKTWTSLHRAVAAMEIVKPLFSAPGRMLVLGLRGGSIAKSFDRDGWTVRAAEPDQVVARVARDHFGLRPADARISPTEFRAYVRSDPRTYDLIVLDAFGSNFIPPHLATREFFGLVASRLSPNGVLAVNVEAMGWNDVLVRSLAATLRSRFETVIALPTSEPPNSLGSIILLAANRTLEIPEDHIPDPVNYLNDPQGHWVVVQMNHAWANRYEPEARGAVVLTDNRNPAELWGERINLAARHELHRFFGPRGGSW